MIGNDCAGTSSRIRILKSRGSGAKKVARMGRSGSCPTKEKVKILTSLREKFSSLSKIK